MFVFENENEIRGLNADMTRIARIDARGIIVTAPGEQVDFVSRFFCPAIRN